MPTAVILQINIITPSSTHMTADMNDDVGTNPPSTSVAIIGAIVGAAIVILIFLLIGVMILIVFFKRKKKSHQREVQLLQNAMLEGNTDTSKTSKEAKEEEEEEEEEGMCVPIYTLPSSTEADSLLQLKPENIKKIKTIGTGYFGKVILANTVGLSLKDLKMSDTDDDKSKSIRVAVKQLKKNPSALRKEAFERELRFMSRLDHPNVI